MNANSFWFVAKMFSIVDWIVISQASNRITFSALGTEDGDEVIEEL